MLGPRNAGPGAEGRFHKEMMALYDRFAELGFRPVLLRRFVLLNGGVAAARELVFKPARPVSNGFTTRESPSCLWKR